MIGSTVRMNDRDARCVYCEQQKIVITELPDPTTATNRRFLHNSFGPISFVVFSAAVSFFVLQPTSVSGQNPARLQSDWSGKDSEQIKYTNVNKLPTDREEVSGSANGARDLREVSDEAHSSVLNSAATETVSDSTTGNTLPGDALEVASLNPTVGELEFIPVDGQPMLNITQGSRLPGQASLCQMRVLNALNRRFPDANLTAENIVPAAADPRLAVVNVNIRGTATQLAAVNKGRYLPRRHLFIGFLIGYGPSLHIVARPTWLDPHALVFSKTMFTAHLDSAWADTPVGLFLHFFIDVLRPHKRNPCP